MTTGFGMEAQTVSQRVAGLQLVASHFTWAYHESMITTVTQKNMVSVPAELARQLDICPGFRFDWEATGPGEIRIKVIPDRVTLARRLHGAGVHVSTGVDSVIGLMAAREAEG